MKRVSVQDVAAQAGVSTATVSRALRDDPRHSIETRQRIQALAKEMGYCPDPLIAALVNRRWDGTGQGIQTLAWVTAFPERDSWKNSFSSEVYAGAEERARSRGYRLETFWLRESGMTARRLSQILFSRGIRGVCLAPLPVGRGHINLKWEHFAAAAIGYSMIRPNLHRACPHHFQGMMEALRQLRHEGFRRIGVWINPLDNRKVNYHWMAGTLLFQELYVKVKVSLLLGKYGDLSGFLKWVEREKLDVVLGAIDFPKSWIDSGLKIPTATLAWSKDSRIAGLDQKPAEIGSAAIDLIIGQIQRNETGIPKTPRVIMTEGIWEDAVQDGRSR